MLPTLLKYPLLLAVLLRQYLSQDSQNIWPATVPKTITLPYSNKNSRLCGKSTSNQQKASMLQQQNYSIIYIIKSFVEHLLHGMSEHGLTSHATHNR